jgi:dolichol-phosphate mannosyltransferase
MNDADEELAPGNRHSSGYSSMISHALPVPCQASSGQSSDEPPVISVVVPLFDEQETLGELHRRLAQTLTSVGLRYEILFIDDGSRDATPQLIDDLRKTDRNLVAIHLSRNFGHQAAVSAGIDHARGQAVIVMDGDLQDPPEVLPLFIAKWREGHEVVYAVRQERKEGWIKKFSYHSFYRILGAISEIDIPLDSGDFCLMDRSVVDTLKHLPEKMRFIRGLRSFVGFRQVGLPYKRAARAAGRPKYTLRRLMGLAIDGLISFSGYPLRLVTYLGFMTIIVALFMLIWVFIDAFLNHTGPRGWASVIVTVLFMGSIELFCLGILGEYIRLIFLETKQRPTYIVRNCPGDDSGKLDSRAGADSDQMGASVA